MKKIKRLMPIICSVGAISTVTPVLASCTFFHNPEKVACSFTGGDTYLLGRVDDEGKVVYDNAIHPWVFKYDNEQVTPTNVEIYPLDQSDFSDIGTFQDEYGGCYVVWGERKMTTLGTHKFVIAATYVDEDDEVYQRISDPITLEITSSKRLVLPQGKDAQFKIIPAVRHADYNQAVNVWEIKLPNCAAVNLPSRCKVLATLNTESDDIGEFCAGEVKPQGGDRADINLWFWAKNSFPTITKRGNYDFTISVQDDYTGETIVFNTPIQVEANFESDSWANVIKYSKQGIKALQDHYGIQDFVGLERTVNINGCCHRVRVIGQEQDVNDKGEILPLTYEFTNLISLGQSSGDGKTASTLLINTHAGTQSSYGYLDSKICDALNSDVFSDWYYLDTDSGEPKNTDYVGGVIKMMDIEVAAALQPIERDYFKTDKNWKVTWTKKAMKLCTPSIHNYLSVPAIMDVSTDIIPSELKPILIQEGHQYQYYWRKLNESHNWTAESLAFYKKDTFDLFVRRNIKNSYATKSYDHTFLSSQYTKPSEGYPISLGLEEDYISDIMYIEPTILNSVYTSMAPIFAI